VDTNRSKIDPPTHLHPPNTPTHPLHVQQQTHFRCIHVSLLLFKCACTYAYVHISIVRSVVEKSPTTIRLFVKRPWKENWHCKEREARPWLVLIESLPTGEGVTVHIRLSHGARMNVSWLTRPPHGAVTGVCCSVLRVRSWAAHRNKQDGKLRQCIS